MMAEMKAANEYQKQLKAQAKEREWQDEMEVRPPAPCLLPGTAQLLPVVTHARTH